LQPPLESMIWAWFLQILNRLEVPIPYILDLFFRPMSENPHKIWPKIWY
jgi:hypothetical protein